MRTFEIASDEDVRRIEELAYAEFMPYGSVFEALAASAAKHARRPALAYLESVEPTATVARWSHGEYLDEVRRAANMFRELGGDEPRIAMLLPAIPQAYFTLFGGEAAGVVCPINYLLSDHHIADLVRTSGANILVALGPSPFLDIWSKVAALRHECPALKHVLAVGGATDALDFDEALRARPGDRLTFERKVRPDTLAALFHTGGTTGAPKLAQHTHGNQLHASWGAAQMYAMSPEDTIINGFPLFHVAGSFVFGLSALLSGAQVILPTLLGMRNADFVRRYWDVVERERVTLLAAVPTVISALMGVPQGSSRIDSVRALLTGGSPLPPELATSFEGRFGIPVRNILGMTECAGVISIEPFRGPRVPGSCGLRLPFTQIVGTRPGSTGTPTQCGPDEPGVLRVRGPNVGPGYTDPNQNAGTLDGDGWLTTGDIGHVGGDGRIFITGRAKDLIIRSGHNIDPGVIEDVLMRHEDVAFAAAVGEPDEYAGEIPVVFVVLKPGTTTDAGQLGAFLERHIPERPALPKRIDFLASLPLTAVGKVYKPALRLKAIERAISERLHLSTVADVVQVSGHDRASGLCLEFACNPAIRSHAIEEAVKALMAPFAIAWRWKDEGSAVTNTRGTP